MGAADVVPLFAVEFVDAREAVAATGVGVALTEGYPWGGAGVAVEVNWGLYVRFLSLSNLPFARFLPCLT